MNKNFRDGWGMVFITLFCTLIFVVVASYWQDSTVRDAVYFIIIICIIIGYCHVVQLFEIIKNIIDVRIADTMFPSSYHHYKLREDKGTILEILFNINEKIENSIGMQMWNTLHKEALAIPIPNGMMRNSVSLPELKKEISSLANLPEDWDNVAALPIDQCAIRRAIQFVHLLNNRNAFSLIDGPNVQPTPEGGVSLGWGTAWGDWYAVRIPPYDGLPICYEAGGENSDPSEYDTESRRYSNNPEVIATELMSDLSAEYESQVQEIMRKTREDLLRT